MINKVCGIETSELNAYIYKLILKENSNIDKDFIETLEKFDCDTDRAFTRTLRYYKRDREINYDKILKMCEDKYTIIECKDVLEQLFLQPIVEDMGLDEKMIRQGWTIKKIIKEHKRCPESKLVTILNRKCRI